MADVGLGGLANALMAQPGRSRVVALTAASTGNPALRSFDLRLPGFFVSVKLAGGATEPEPVTPERDALVLHALEGTIDLVIADPHHTYAASVTGVAQALRLLRPGGLMLMHDCLPPPDLMGPEFRHGSWCGESYAAFRDVCTAHGLPWFTINADFGIGVVAAAAPNPGRVAAPTLPDHDAMRSRQTYLADPYAFMRAVAPSDADVAIARLAAGEPVDDLIEVFDGWDEAPTAHDEFDGELVDARIAVKLLSQQNEMLRRELAATRANQGGEQVGQADI